MKLLAIVGSSRSSGNTSYLVDQALGEAARLGAATEKVMLCDYRIAPCQGHDKCRTFAECVMKDDAAVILDKMMEADGVILATPVYYYNVSAQLKTFIDRTYFTYTHDRTAKAKAIGNIIVAGSEGVEDTLTTLQKYINATFNVDGRRIFTVSGFASSAGTVKTNASLVNEAKKLGRQMVESLKGV